MADTFNIDPNLMNAVKDHAQNIQASMAATQDSAVQINTVLADMGRTYADMLKAGKDLGLGPEFLSKLQSMNKVVTDIGKQFNISTNNVDKEIKVLKIVQNAIDKIIRAVRQKNVLLEQENKLVKAEGTEVDNLQKKVKKLQDEKEKAKAKKDEQGYLMKEGTNLTFATVKMAGLGDVIQKSDKNVLGFRLSLAGILKLIMDIMNKSNVIAGYSKMAAFSFKEWEPRTAGAAKSIGVANRALWDLRSRFRLNFDEAGKLTSKVTQAGFEMEDMGTSVTRAGSKTKDWQGTASRMLAVQTLQGRSLDTQLQSVMDLRNNFGELVTSAQSLDALIGDMGKKIPGLTAQDAVTSVMEMGRGMRFFTTNLLDSITLYHSLNNAAEEHRKKVAEAQKYAKKTGQPYQAPQVTSPWGKTWITAPLEIRKSLLQWMTSAPARLAPGVQSLLGGGGPGTSATGKLWNFIKGMEKESPFEFYKKSMEAVLEMTKGAAAEPGQRYVEAQTLLQSQFQMPPELAAFAARGIAEGKINVNELKKLDATLKNEQEATRKQLEKRDKLMGDYLKTGVEVNTNLMSMEDRLKKWVEDKLITPVQMIKDFVSSISDRMKEVAEFLNVFTGQGKEEAAVVNIKGSLDKALTRAGVLDTIPISIAGEATKAVVEAKAAKELKGREFKFGTRWAHEKAREEGIYSEIKTPEDYLKFFESNMEEFAGVMSEYNFGRMQHAMTALRTQINLSKVRMDKDKKQSINMKNDSRAQMLEETNVSVNEALDNRKGN